MCPLLPSSLGYTSALLKEVYESDYFDPKEKALNLI
jgi:hypothetical protein